MNRLPNAVVEQCAKLLMDGAHMKDRLSIGTALLLSIPSSLHAGVIVHAPQLREEWEREFPAVNAMMTLLTTAGEKPTSVATEATIEILRAFESGKMQAFAAKMKAAVA